MNEPETINILMAIPMDTIRMVCEAEYADEEGQHMARAVYDARHIHRAFNDAMLNLEGFFRDYPHLVDDDAETYPVIIEVPELAHTIKICYTTERTENFPDGNEGMVTYQDDTTLSRNDIRRMREEFLKYVPDGDHYNDVFTLTDRALEWLQNKDDDYGLGWVRPKETGGINE